MTVTVRHLVAAHRIADVLVTLDDQSGQSGHSPEAGPTGPTARAVGWVWSIDPNAGAEEFTKNSKNSGAGVLNSSSSSVSSLGRCQAHGWPVEPLGCPDCASGAA